jgi:hypothetical protein
MANKLLQTVHESLSKETITWRFMRCVDVVIANRIKGMKNYTAVGNMCGIHQQNFTKFRQQTQFATTEHIALLCHHFGVSINYIMLGLGTIEEVMPLTMRVQELENRVLELEKLTSIASHKIVTKKTINSKK